MFQRVQAAGQDDAATMPAGVAARLSLPSSRRGQPGASFNDLSKAVATSDRDNPAV